MFVSRRRAVVFPQAEHARLSGAIALAWGNASFSRPRLPYASFVAGVALHDRGYAQLDDDPIGGVAAERWLAIQRAGAEPRGLDAVEDVVVALHVRRLLGHDHSPADDALRAAVDAAVERIAAEGGVDLAAARDADRITDLADRIAFDFCFEEEARGSVAVRPSAEAPLVAVAYEVDGTGGVTIDPWPLGVPVLTGLLVGFHREGYPAAPEPVVVPYRIAPRG